MKLDIEAYSRVALPHLQSILKVNGSLLQKIGEQLVQGVPQGKKLFVFGSGHSTIFPMETYHRAGGPSFVIPISAPYFLPLEGPRVVRVMERASGCAAPLLDRAQPEPGEMIWIASQSGINHAGVEMALAAREKKLHTVAFTSRVHSQSVAARHPSGKRLFEVCDDVVDLGGFVGDAAVPITPTLSTGPLSSLTCIFLAHSILSAVIGELERQGVRCCYSSVNTSDGESRNRQLEEDAKTRDPLLR